MGRIDDLVPLEELRRRFAKVFDSGVERYESFHNTGERNIQPAVFHTDGVVAFVRKFDRQIDISI